METFWKGLFLAVTLALSLVLLLALDGCAAPVRIRSVATVTGVEESVSLGLKETVTRRVEVYRYTNDPEDE